jgi:hypothetical protein
LRAELLGIKGTWREIADSGNTTVHREPGTRTPSSAWKRRLLMSEHSMIRQLIVKIKWHDLKSWVSVHFVRHKFGIEHWVRTQRTDRTGLNRDEIPQGALVEHEIEANAQAVINISRKRLCGCASPETRAAWEAALHTLRDAEPELYAVCVPDCVYRGHCYEFKSCRYHQTEDFTRRLVLYRGGIHE